MKSYQMNAEINVVTIHVGQLGIAIHDVRRLDQDLVS